MSLRRDPVTSSFMTGRGMNYKDTTSHTFLQPILTRQAFLDTRKDVAKPVEWRPLMAVANPPASGRSWLMHSWARHVGRRSPRADTSVWEQPLTFVVRRDAHPCVLGVAIRMLSLFFFYYGSHSLMCQAEKILAQLSW